MIGRTVDELEVGQTAEVSRVVRRQDITEFVDSVGDRNPIHTDPAFAATTPFQEPIAPGVWTAGLISAAIGMHLPGPGSIYLSQDLRFLKPVRFGDAVTARVEVVEVRPERNRVRLKTTCRNQRYEEVLSGEAWVAPPKRTVAGGRRVTAALPPWDLRPWRPWEPWTEVVQAAVTWSAWAAVRAFELPAAWCSPAGGGTITSR